MNNTGRHVTVLLSTVIIATGFVLFGSQDKGGNERPIVLATSIASAPQGTIAVLGHGSDKMSHMKFVGPPASNGIRLVVWCTGGPVEARSFALDSETTGIFRLVQPHDSFYQMALANCGRERGN